MSPGLSLGRIQLEVNHLFSISLNKTHTVFIILSPVYKVSITSVRKWMKCAVEM